MSTGSTLQIPSSLIFGTHLIFSRSTPTGSPHPRCRFTPRRTRSLGRFCRHRRPGSPAHTGPGGGTAGGPGALRQPVGGGAPGRAQPAGVGTGQPREARKERVPALRGPFGTLGPVPSAVRGEAAARRDVRGGAVPGCGRRSRSGSAPRPHSALPQPPAPAAPGRSLAASAAAGKGLPGAVGSACGVRSAAGSLPLSLAASAAATSWGERCAERPPRPPPPRPAARSRPPASAPWRGAGRGLPQRCPGRGGGQGGQR